MPPELVTLTAVDNAATASILVGYGCNCFSFRPVINDQSVEVLWAEEGYETGEKRASSSGIPVLFPFPGRIQGTTMKWRDKDYALDAADGRENAIHGFVHTRPWRTIEQTGDTLTTEFQASVDDPSLLKKWPADFRIRMQFRLAENCLTITTEVSNPSDEDLPYGFGLHPYFRVPLIGDSADDCRVTIPANSAWEMEEMIATGKRLPLENGDELRAGVRFGDMAFDNGFGELQSDGETVVSEIIDPAGAKLTLEFSKSFPEIVVYNPGHREAVCVEPYTCICDPFRLQSDDLDAGLRVLAPGESLRDTASIAVTAESK